MGPRRVEEHPTGAQIKVDLQSRVVNGHLIVWLAAGGGCLGYCIAWVTGLPKRVSKLEFLTKHLEHWGRVRDELTGTEIGNPQQDVEFLKIKWKQVLFPCYVFVRTGKKIATIGSPSANGLGWFACWERCLQQSRAEQRQAVMLVQQMVTNASQSYVLKTTSKQKIQYKCFNTPLLLVTLWTNYGPIPSKEREPII